jgi:hypothetical protein
MKSLCLILLLAVSVPGCSRFTKSGRMDRAYYKQLKQAKIAREKRRKNLIQHQRAEMPSLRNSPPPLLQPTYQRAPDNQ